LVSVRDHARFWVVALLVILGVVWVLSDVLLPFIAGAAIAYLLGPIVGRMIRAGVPRVAAAGLILTAFFVVLAAVLALILPFAYRELMQLAKNIPAYTVAAQENLIPYIEWMRSHFPNQFPEGDLSAFQETMKQNVDKIFKFGGNIVGGFVTGGQAVVGAATFLILAPIVAFFMMAEWVRVTKWIDDMIPRGSYVVIRDLLTQIDRKLSGFIRGQVMVSLLLGILYAVALTLAGLKFGFLIGLMAGVLSIIPLVGSTIGLVVSVLVAWFQSGEIGYVGIIAAIFLVGQLLEGNVITPRIMGKSVGLHPLWILFALLAGGALFGIVGMLLAVPVAAVIGVLGAFAIRQYKESPYYNEDPITAEPVTDIPVLVIEDPAEQAQNQ
jgi:predicted PurR-regulated permease PerM